MSATDLDRYLPEEVAEKAAIATYEEMQRPNWRAPLWDEIDEPGRERFLNAARASLSAVLPDIIQQAKAEALRELRDYLTETRRLWCGDMGVRVALVIDDPRSHLALSDYLNYRADRIEHDARCPHPKCPGGGLCCCLSEQGGQP